MTDWMRTSGTNWEFPASAGSGHGSIVQRPEGYFFWSVVGSRGEKHGTTKSIDEAKRKAEYWGDRVGLKSSQFTLGPPPSDPSKIKFDPNLFEKVGEKTEYVVVLPAPRGPQRFRTRAEAEAFAKRVGRPVEEWKSPIMERKAWFSVEGQTMKYGARWVSAGGGYEEADLGNRMVLRVSSGTEGYGMDVVWEVMTDGGVTLKEGHAKSTSDAKARAESAARSLGAKFSDARQYAAWKKIQQGGVDMWTMYGPDDAIATVQWDRYAKAFKWYASNKHDQRKEGVAPTADEAKRAAETAMASLGGQKTMFASRQYAARDVEAAVQAMRLYMGSEGASIRDQQKLYDRMSRLVQAVEKRTGITNASDQITERAKALGPIWPRPGKDYAARQYAAEWKYDPSSPRDFPGYAASVGEFTIGASTTGRWWIQRDGKTVQKGVERTSGSSPLGAAKQAAESAARSMGAKFGERAYAADWHDSGGVWRVTFSNKVALAVWRSPHPTVVGNKSWDWQMWDAKDRLAGAGKNLPSFDDAKAAAERAARSLGAKFGERSMQAKYAIVQANWVSTGRTKAGEFLKAVYGSITLHVHPDTSGGGYEWLVIDESTHAQERGTERIEGDAQTKAERAARKMGAKFTTKEHAMQAQASAKYGEGKVGQKVHVAAGAYVGDYTARLARNGYIEWVSDANPNSMPITDSTMQKWIEAGNASLKASAREAKMHASDPGFIQYVPDRNAAGAAYASATALSVEEKGVLGWLLSQRGSAKVSVFSPDEQKAVASLVTSGLAKKSGDTVTITDEGKRTLTGGKMSAASVAPSMPRSYSAGLMSGYAVVQPACKPTGTREVRVSAAKYAYVGSNPTAMDLLLAIHEDTSTPPKFQPVADGAKKMARSLVGRGLIKDIGGEWYALTDAGKQYIKQQGYSATRASEAGAAKYGAANWRNTTLSGSQAEMWGADVKGASLSIQKARTSDGWYWRAYSTMGNQKREGEAPSKSDAMSAAEAAARSMGAKFAEAKNYAATWAKSSRGTDAQEATIGHFDLHVMRESPVSFVWEVRSGSSRIGIGSSDSASAAKAAAENAVRENGARFAARGAKYGGVTFMIVVRQERTGSWSASVIDPYDGAVVFDLGMAPSRDEVIRRAKARIERDSGIDPKAVTVRDAKYSHGRMCFSAPPGWKEESGGVESGGSITKELSKPGYRLVVMKMGQNDYRWMIDNFMTRRYVKRSGSHASMQSAVDAAERAGANFAQA